ncbi:MAG: hypothetical protein ACE5GC_03145 [Acidimicrobiia bacterium]
MLRSFLTIVERMLFAAVAILLLVIVAVLFVQALRGTTRTSPANGGESAASTAATAASSAADFSTGSCEEELPPEREGTTLLRVFYTCGTGTAPTGDSFVFRTVPATDEPLEATLRQLVAGPSNDEIDLGFRSVFTSADAEIIDSVSIRGRKATVDFTSLPVINNLAPEDDVGFFVANLNANVFQHAAIRTVEYRIDGSCSAFWAHVADGTGCRVVAEENFTADMAANLDS